MWSRSHWKLQVDQPRERLVLSCWWPPLGQRRLELSKPEGVLRLRSSWGQSRVIPLSKITSIYATISPEDGHDLRLVLQIKHQTEQGEQQARAEFQAQGVDLYGEALDLLFRMAQLLGWSWYTLQRKDETGIELELHAREADPFRSDQLQLKEVPEITAPASYRSTQTLRAVATEKNLRPGFTEPEHPVAAFLPNQITAPWSVPVWEPKQKIVLQRAALRSPIQTFFYCLFFVPVRFVAIWCCAALLAAGIVGGAAYVLVLPIAALLSVFFPTLMELVPEWAAFLVGGLSLLFLTYLVARDTLRDALRSFSFQAELNWRGDLFMTTRALLPSQRPLSHIRAITLVTCKDDLSSFDNQQETWYEVRADLGLRWVALWESRQHAVGSSAHKITAYALTAYALTIALARALNVPFREETD